jgi:flagellar basal body-associated protein FliL
MTDNFGAPLAEPKKSNTTMIIIIVVVVVLLCCCCSTIGILWQFGDQIMAAIGGF